MLSFTEGPRGNRSYNSQTQRFVIGPAVGIRFQRGLGVEAGALYQRLHFDGHEVRFTVISPGNEGARGSSSSTAASLWEFPLFIKYRFPGETVRPYLGAGPSFSRIAGIRQSIECFDFIGPCRGGGVFEDAPELRNRSALGIAVGGGVELKAGRLRVSPEVRYVHYGQEHFVEPTADLIRSNKNRLYFLLGIDF